MSIPAPSEQSSPLAHRPWLSAYADGVPAEIDPVDQTLVDLLSASVSRYPKEVALEFFGRQTTYAELGERVERVANGLRKQGVVAGDRVALVLPNCPQHVVAFYAVLRLGAIVVEHNPLYTARELRHQFEVHGAVAAIVWDKVADTIAEMPSDVRPRTIVSVRMPDALPLGKRLALKLPVPAARETRTAMTARPTAKKLVAWKTLTGTRRLSKKVAAPTLDDIALLLADPTTATTRYRSVCGS